MQVHEFVEFQDRLSESYGRAAGLAEGFMLRSRKYAERGSLKEFFDSAREVTCFSYLYHVHLLNHKALCTP